MPLFRRANALISQASGSLSRTEKLVDALIADVRDAIEEVKDGVTLELTKTGEGSMLDFFMGRIDTLPIAIRVKLRESLDKK